jgi:cytochrome P450
MLGKLTMIDQDQTTKMGSQSSMLEDFQKKISESSNWNEPFWSSRTKSWVVINPNQAHSALRSNKFNVVEHGKQFQTAASELNINLSALIKIFPHVPLSLNGQEHQQQRRIFATNLMKNVNPALANFKVSFSRLLRERLSSNSSFDIAGDVIFPSTLNAFSSLTGIPPSILAKAFNSDISISQAISRPQLLNKTRLEIMNSMAQELLNQTRNEVSKVVLAVVGFEPFRSTICHVTSDELRSAKAMRLDRHKFHAKPHVSGLPYTERICVEDSKIGNQLIKKGDWLTVYLGAFADCPIADASLGTLFFGAGMHLCLGKKFTEDAWKTVANELATIGHGLEVVTENYKPIDFVFHNPVSLVVRAVR